MRWYRSKILMLFLASIAVSLWQPGCGTKSVTSEAAAPSGPIEIPAPAILKFVGYQDMKIDLSKVTSIVSTSDFKAVDLFEPDPAVMRMIIWEGPYFFELFANEFFAPAMEGIKKIEIPVSEDVKTFEAVITFVPTTEQDQSCWLCIQNPECKFKKPSGALCAPDSSGVLRTADGRPCTDTSDPNCILRKSDGTTCPECILRKANGDACTVEESWLPRKVKLDFADFNFENLDKAEGCSGSSKKTSDTTPICVRFWLGKGAYTPDKETEYQYDPFLAGVFEEYPYENNPVVSDTIGKGKFKIYVADFDGYESSFAYSYEQKAGTSSLKAAASETLPSKGIEYFFRITYLPDSPYNLNRCQGRYWCIDLSFDKWDWHTTLNQEGPAETAFKSVKFNWEMVDKPQDMKANYIGQWVEDDIFWSGSISNRCPECSPLEGDPREQCIQSHCSQCEGMWSHPTEQNNCMTQNCPDCASIAKERGVSSEYLNMCATLLDGIFFGIGATECTAVGARDTNILVGDTPFLNPLELVDVLFPRDFPADPTFK
jgi:hypothetical protein